MRATGRIKKQNKDDVYSKQERENEGKNKIEREEKGKTSRKKDSMKAIERWRSRIRRNNREIMKKARKTGEEGRTENEEQNQGDG
jgi:hypothetical protein